MTSRIYLDHNATTPIDPQVRAAMEPYFGEVFGNPSSVEHEDGRLAAEAVEHAREQVAAAIGARPSEIVFTGGATEANNMAILGAARAQPSKRHIITTQVEHAAVLGPTSALEREGWRITYLPVDGHGQVSPNDVKTAITTETVLVSVMAANNEVGTLQPIQAIGAICAEGDVLFHTDAAQLPACGKLDVARDNVHLASLSSHKAYGPKGIGVLYVRSRCPRAKLVPITFGGGQERGLRPGTLNTAAIVGMGRAFEIAARAAVPDTARLVGMCKAFRDGLSNGVTGSTMNGHPTERLPNNMSFSIEGVEPFALIRALRKTCSFSAASACSTGKVGTSHVLKAMFGDGSRARGAFRISPGRFTTTAEMQAALDATVDQVAKLRRVGAASAVLAAEAVGDDGAGTWT